jgi:hypothetical protein
MSRSTVGLKLTEVLTVNSLGLLFGRPAPSRFPPFAIDLDITITSVAVREGKLRQGQGYERLLLVASEPLTAPAPAYGWEPNQQFEESIL